MPDSASAAAPVAGRRSLAVVGFLAFIELCSGVLQGGFPALLPAIGAELHLSAGDLSTAFSAELLASGVTVLLLSRLGDLYGHRRLIQITVTLTLLGYVLTAVAGSYPVLIAGRILSGLLACWLPLEFAIVRDRLGAERSGPAVGLLVGALSVGLSAGTLAVGLLDDAVPSVRVSLWVLAGLTAVCLLVSLLLIPESSTRARSAVDWRGGVLVSVGLGLLFHGTGALSSDPAGAALCLVPGAVLLALFVRHERRTAEPLIDVRLMAGKALAPLMGLSVMLGFSLYGAMTSSSTFAATDPRYGFGWGLDTLGVALLSLCTALGILAGGLVADRVAGRAGGRAVLAGGFGLSAAGYALMTLLHARPWQFGAGLLVNGFGVGLAMSTIPALIMRRVPAEQTAVGTGVYNTLKSLAGGIGGAAFGAVLNRMLAADPAARAAGVAGEGAYVTIWSGCAVLCVLAVVIALALRRPEAAAVPGAPGAAHVPGAVSP